MNSMLAEIRIFAGNFAPRDWAFCHGQLLAISNNTALFSLLGCTYGGDCRTSFALPDFRGRMAIGAGVGPGLTPRFLGGRAGQETHTLNILELPQHTHGYNNNGYNNNAAVAVSTNPPTSDNPSNKVYSNASFAIYTDSGNADFKYGQRNHYNWRNRSRTASRKYATFHCYALYHSNGRVLPKSELRNILTSYQTHTCTFCMGFS